MPEDWSESFVWKRLIVTWEKRYEWVVADVDEMERGWRAVNRKVRSERKQELVECDLCRLFWQGKGGMKTHRRKCKQQ